LLWLLPAASGAYDFEVTARTEGYGYQVRHLGPNGVTFLNRRRVTQYLGLRVFNLLDPGQEAFSPTRKGRPPALLTGHALMRFHTDFGGYTRSSQQIPELENNQLELMLGALEGRNLWGWIDFTLGRQVDAELMDFFVYDGLRVRVSSPWGLFAETHLGLQTRRQNPLSSTITIEADGPHDESTEDDLAPTFGVALGVEELWGLDLRAAYRGVASEAETTAAAGGDEGQRLWGIDQELLFFSAAYQLPLLETRPHFGLRYNMLTGGLDEVQVAAQQRLGAGRHRIQLEYLHSRPHFDGDSIFNIFASEPFNEIAGSYSVAVADPLELAARGGYRRFWADQDGDDQEPDAISLGLGGLWRTSRLRAALDLFYLGGLRDRTVGGDLVGRWSPLRRLSLEGRVSLIWYRLAHRADAEVLNFGFQLGSTARLAEGVRIHVVFEDNISRLYDSALRLLGVLDLELAP
jgi:hypothetical protein